MNTSECDSADLKWYLADLVLEYHIEGDTRNVVHTDTVLIRALDAEEAYQKASARGAEEIDTYLNTENQQVTVTFRGLEGLYLVYEELEDGAEIIYREEVGVAEETLQQRLVAKEQLAVFRPQEKPTRLEPNYLPKSMMDMLQAEGFAEDDLYRPDDDDEVRGLL